MNICRDTIRRIHESGGTLDPKSIEHCLQCSECRRELLARLAADNPEAPSVPEALNRNVLLQCRSRHPRKIRRNLRRTLIWSGAAAAAAAVALLFGVAEIPAHSDETDFTVANSEWDGTALLGKISDIGAELETMEELLTNEMERVEI